jgi:8-oxo-dGTP pyrophosphatase MutT (NUDIX family)
MTSQYTHVIAVGGIVRRASSILLIRQRYGPAQAVLREIAEETGIRAIVRGIVGVRTRCDGPRSDTYVMFLLDWSAGEPSPDGQEIDDARFFTLEELRDPDRPITALSRYVALRVLAGSACLQSFASDFDYAAAGRDPATWRLFC